MRLPVSPSTRREQLLCPHSVHRNGVLTTLSIGSRASGLPPDEVPHAPHVRAIGRTQEQLTLFQVSGGNARARQFFSQHGAASSLGRSFVCARLWQFPCISYALLVCCSRCAATCLTACHCRLELQRKGSDRAEIHEQSCGAVQAATFQRGVRVQVPSHASRVALSLSQCHCRHRVT